MMQNPSFTVQMETERTVKKAMNNKVLKTVLIVCKFLYYSPSLSGLPTVRCKVKQLGHCEILT